jgi:hypothetical protein
VGLCNHRKTRSGDASSELSKKIDGIERLLQVQNDEAADGVLQAPDDGRRTPEQMQVLREI